MPAIIKCGHVFAEDIYSLDELLNHQIAKGFQPVGPLLSMDHGNVKVFIQKIVQYQTPKRQNGNSPTKKIKPNAI
jgi:hypothetical protein